jgi:hypothetical protein
VVATYAEIEEMTTTKSEKLLAVVLAAFLLIGAFWAYARIDDAVRSEVTPGPVAPTATERAALDRASAAQASVGRAESERIRALEALELRREAYRTALDAGAPAAELERRYRDAERALARAETELATARAEAAAATPAAEAAQRRLSDAAVAREDRRALLAFVGRGLFALGVLALGLWALARLRRRGSRALPLAFAVVATGTILALALAGDYVTDYVDPLELGPLVLSLAGIALTIAAFWALQRYLARRLPLRRAKKRECPSCGYPAETGRHCGGCGREVIATCGSCGGPRRVAAPHCTACGQA